MTPKALFLAGAGLLAITGIAIVLWPSSKPQRAAPPPATTTAPPAPTTTAPPPPPPTTTAPLPKPPPPAVPMSWEHAGAFVWHTHDVDPQWLGEQLRAAGFGWVAVYVGKDGAADPPDDGWIYRFSLASGLPVGGWSVLGNEPHADAALAARMVRRESLSFFIANAEAPYQADPARSQQFVDAFRAAEPSLPAGLSSLCDARGIDLVPWAGAGFAFLPQAYVKDFGSNVAPAHCVRAASPFPPSEVHPTVGSYRGQKGWVLPQTYTRLLAQAGTTGFSVYLAETNMPDTSWQAYGQAIAQQHLAVKVS